MSHSPRDAARYIKDFVLTSKTKTEYININGNKIPVYTNEFWTSKQRQASSIHEISYRACFKPQLPRFFINLLTQKGDIVYDPFSGRGTTAIEAGILGRNIVSNDINPLSRILTLPRFFVPNVIEVKERLENITYDMKLRADIDLSMFYHPKTEAEIVSLKNYLKQRESEKKEDKVDLWIRMVATNRLTGHSPGFFSVYTLPPNQAVTAERQQLINAKRNQKPEYRDTKKLIMKKTKSLIRNIKEQEILNLRKTGNSALFLSEDARRTPQIPDESVSLTVTSPPFLDVVQYDSDNWLRCWFNGIDAKKVANTITMSKNIQEWSCVMEEVFYELYRITKKGGWVAFEVGEVKGGKIKLDEYVVPLGQKAGFCCQGILINLQEFTKTSNIWGIGNNKSGTNTNRIVLFVKD
ncbi:MAG TPA: site-specific DNA-methyltransferase [Tepidanaerobacter syntrophicus]|uniref:DNA methyltransferase n=1 Tax=Tepidanaerobacter syntrophicus TaxID=224999 RepID=UPI00176C5557|nr:DNA methyltransferase [Tepidanaerobacter syntrophicus]HHV83231.1 site-specific DNA-methyltransferase [Tepidanaerobacter syntrophicus]